MSTDLYPNGVPTARLLARLNELTADTDRADRLSAAWAAKGFAGVPERMSVDAYRAVESLVAEHEGIADPFVDSQLGGAIEALTDRVKRLIDPDLVFDRIAVEAGGESRVSNTTGKGLGRRFWITSWSPGRYKHALAIVEECEANQPEECEANAHELNDIAQDVNTSRIEPTAADLPPVTDAVIDPDPAHPPTKGTMKDVLAWVEGSPLGTLRERAEMALRVEANRPTPRAGLVKKLEALTGDVSEITAGGASTPHVEPSGSAGEAEGVSAASPADHEAAAAPNVAADEGEGVAGTDVPAAPAAPSVADALDGIARAVVALAEALREAA